MDSTPQPQNPKPEIDLVMFDLGRVLLRIADDWDHAALLANLPELAGLTGDLSTKAARGSHHPLAELFDHFETGKVTVVEFFATAAKLADVKVDEVRRVTEAVLIEAFPGAIALLDRLSLEPVKVGCLSNTNAHHWQMFTSREHAAYLPIELFDYPLGSQIVGLAKPDPAIYQYVEDGTEIPPANILFFDDLQENIDAALARGWQAELVSRDTDNPIPAVIAKLEAYGVL
ncbi:HAD-IA family hydrolase [Algisphaera agarilytica]|uniref:HAD-IA family hydrolase n=1 Tax=Algisphaera agarilytica TaxID=1385975 RepID=UPI001C885A59|nr:HAD-IA family hydrolase [Algisphaera agarilytica]